MKTDLTPANHEAKFLGGFHHAVAAIIFGKTFPCPPWDEDDDTLPDLGWGLLGVAYSSVSTL